MILTALGHPVSMNAWMGVSVGLLFAVIGNYFGKIRSNFFFGIRTPWTLASERSWNRTHRIGGRLFMAMGFFLVVFALIPSLSAYSWIAMVGGIGIIVPVVFLYSYRTWKSDPDRSPQVAS